MMGLSGIQIKRIQYNPIHPNKSIPQIQLFPLYSFLIQAKQGVIGVCWRVAANAHESVGSYLVLVEDHIGDSVDDGVLSLAVGAHQLSLDDMRLHVGGGTSRMMRCNFLRFSSFSRYSAVRSLGKLVSPMSVTVLQRAYQSSFLTSFLMFSRLKSLERQMLFSTSMIRGKLFFSHLATLQMSRLWESRRINVDRLFLLYQGMRVDRDWEDRQEYQWRSEGQGHSSRLWLYELVLMYVSSRNTGLYLCFLEFCTIRLSLLRSGSFTLTLSLRLMSSIALLAATNRFLTISAFLSSRPFSSSSLSCTSLSLIIFISKASSTSLLVSVAMRFLLYRTILWYSFICEFLFLARYFSMILLAMSLLSEALLLLKICLSGLILVISSWMQSRIILFFTFSPQKTRLLLWVMFSCSSFTAAAFSQRLYFALSDFSQIEYLISGKQACWHCSMSLGEMDRWDYILFQRSSVLILGCFFGLVRDLDTAYLPQVLILKLFLMGLMSLPNGSSVNTIFLNSLGQLIALTSCATPLMNHSLSSLSSMLFLMSCEISLHFWQALMSSSLNLSSFWKSFNERSLQQFSLKSSLNRQYGFFLVMSRMETMIALPRSLFSATMTFQ